MAEGNEPRPFESRIFHTSYFGNTGENGVITPSSMSPNNIRIISAYAGGSLITIPFVAASDNTWRFYVINSNLQIAKNVDVTIYYTVLYI